MKKTLAIVLVLAFVLGGLTACGEEEKKEEAAPAPKEPTELSEEMKIVIPAGGEPLMAGLPEDYQLVAPDTREQVKGAILSGEHDMAVVSPMTAAELYAESGGKILTVSPIKTGGISILYFGMELEEQSPSDLSGRRIITAEEGEPSQYVLDQAVREDEGYAVFYENVESQAEVADALKNYNTYALVTEPHASKIMAEDGNVKKIVDVDAFWKAKGHKDIPTWVLVTGKWETEENRDDIKVFGKDYKKAIEKGKESELVFYDKSNRGDGIVRDFLRELIELDKNVMNGKMPPNEMFYKMRFPI